MKIIKDINKVVLFAGDLELTATGLTGPGWTAPSITTANHTEEYVKSLPDFWVGGHYFYDGEWTLTVIGQAAKDLRDAEIFQNIYKTLEAAVDNHVEAVGMARGYRSRTHAMDYTSFENPWKVECTKYGEWFASCYLHCQTVQTDVLAGKRDIPTEQELIAELPEMVWV